MGEKLYLQPKMGLVPEISMQNYDTIAKQLREIISNSLDAGAKNSHIALLLTKNSANLIIEDDGKGMSKDDIKDQFLALGGSEKYYDKTKIGRIGIGFLAAVPLCEFVEITTRKKGSDVVIIARLESDKLTLEDLRMKAIKDHPVGEILEELKDADKLGYAQNFTKISLINIKPLVVETFKSEKKFNELKEELRRILPLKYNPKSKIFSHISKQLKEELISNAEEYSLNVYLNSNEPLTRRAYGDYDEEVIYAVKEFKEEKVDKKIRVVGYFIYKKNLEGKRSVEVRRWDGLVLRVQNVAVVDSGFLGFSGGEERKKRVCGDISILGINKNNAITIDRNNFKEDDPEYLEVKKFIHEKLEEFFKDGVNFDWALKSELNKTIGVAVKLNDAMEYASKKLSLLKGTKKGPEKHLKDYKKARLIDTSTIRGKYANLNLTPEKNIDSKKSYKITWKDIEGKKGEIKIDSDLYNRDIWDFEIEGKTYPCQFVEGSESSSPCEFDSKKSIFYINKNNPIIKSFKSDYIIICILIEYCRVKSKNKKDFSDKLVHLLEGLI